MKPLNTNALRILQNRYLWRNEEGDIIETPHELFHRVAHAIARAEENIAQQKYWEEEFYLVLNDLLFLPNSPTLVNAGRPNQQLSACFVLPVDDSLVHIFNTLKSAALIQQSGGGTGFNFSKLRPKGDRVSSSDGRASGPVSFMKIFDAATEHIKQGGKRRGANMGVLCIAHPDIEEFIEAKRNENALVNFNISVGITDRFMKALIESTDWPLLHPHSGKTVRTVDAKQLWNKIIEMAWQQGDPGLLFLDEINRYNPTPSLGSIECTNPCGEVPLLPYEPCNLGSVNLSLMITTAQRKQQVDWKKLEKTVKTGIRFLDNVIDVNNYLLPEIKTMALGNRKIGLGVMGWAEMLVHLGIPYESEEALTLAVEVMKFMSEKSRDASVAIANEKNVFKNWEQSIYYPHTKIRNATRTSIAPTGTISILAGTSSSIEPYFALAYQRKNVLDNQTLDEINPLVMDYLQKAGHHSENLRNAIATEGRLPDDASLPSPIHQLFKTSLEIDYRYHIRHQLAFQQHTDNAISKTINLPNAATQQDIENAFLLAWQGKAKGITVYRNGCKGHQVLNTGIPNLKTDVCKVCID
jgi:ribonucleoside-diphosphate reductase alpha chain